MAKVLLGEYTKKGVGGYRLDEELRHLGYQVGNKRSSHYRNSIAHVIQINCGLVLWAYESFRGIRLTHVALAQLYLYCLLGLPKKVNHQKKIIQIFFPKFLFK